MGDTNRKSGEMAVAVSPLLCSSLYLLSPVSGSMSALSELLYNQRLFNFLLPLLQVCVPVLGIVISKLLVV